MAKLTAAWLNDLLAGDEIRRVIRSQSPDKGRKTIFALKNLLVDVSPDTKPLSALGKYLHEHKKPLHLVKSKTGCAPAGTRWICVLCPNQKQIKTRTNDLRRHLEERHFCEKSEIDKVFDPKDENRLWDHFGPCTKVQASANGWEVGSYETRRNKKTKLAKTAFAEVKGPILKGVQYVETLGKRKKSATSDSEFDSGLESSTQMMKSMNLNSKTPQMVTTNTDIDGPTLVPHQTVSSAADTFPFILPDKFYSPILWPADPPSDFMAQDPSTDLLGFSGQFQLNQNGPDSEIIQMAYQNLPEFDNMEENYFAPYDKDIPVSISNPTILDQTETLMEPSLPTAQTQIDNDFHTGWDVVGVDECELPAFPIFSNQAIQQPQSNS